MSWHQSELHPFSIYIYRSRLASLACVSVWTLTLNKYRYNHCGIGTLALWHRLTIVVAIFDWCFAVCSFWELSINCAVQTIVLNKYYRILLFTDDNLWHYQTVIFMRSWQLLSVLLGFYAEYSQSNFRWQSRYSSCSSICSRLRSVWLSGSLIVVWTAHSLSFCIDGSRRFVLNQMIIDRPSKLRRYLWSHNYRTRLWLSK